MPKFTRDKGIRNLKKKGFKKSKHGGKRNRHIYMFFFNRNTQEFEDIGFRIYNDHKKNTSALLTLNKIHISAWMKNEKIKSSEEIIDQIRKEMLLFSDQPEFKGKFPNKWIPSNFQILEEEFSEENKMINSTLKMVRHRITETYQDRLDVMYGGNAQKKSLNENLEVISKLFFI